MMQEKSAKEVNEMIKTNPELKIIDVFICKLRKKLSAVTGGDNYIETVWGRGYVLRDPKGANDVADS